MNYPNGKEKKGEDLEGEGKQGKIIGINNYGQLIFRFSFFFFLTNFIS